ncbi:hypothetical protein GGI07_005830 [Coemansia sp. Benny D115]|nr:hypothetical protein GGI07_005830 [Coemansia sp. Benny D115]
MASDSGKLTQSDFRKLLHTSSSLSKGDTVNKHSQGTRRGRVLGGKRQLHIQQHAKATTRTVAAAALLSPLPAAEASGSMPADATLHTPSMPSAQHRNNQAIKNTQKSAFSAKKYRDRAAERRSGHSNECARAGDGVSGWHAAVQSGRAVFDASEEGLGAGMSAERRMAYEKSKYLGGDAESTHLVKGLDYLLLDKVRGAQNDASDSADLESELDCLVKQEGGSGARTLYGLYESDTGGVPSAIMNSDVTAASTTLGARILQAVQQSQASKRRAATGAENTIVALANELFLPRRMYFEFVFNGQTRVTARIQSKDEIRPADGRNEDTGWLQGSASDQTMLLKISTAISAAHRRRNEMQRTLANGDCIDIEMVKDSDAKGQNSYMARQPAQPKVLYPEPTNLGRADDASDEDIFADAGLDYQVTIGRGVKANSTRPGLPGTAASELHAEPHTELLDEDYSITEPYPELPDEDYSITEPYPEPPDEDYNITEPYPEPPDESFQESESYSDHCADELPAKRHRQGF